MTGRVAVTGATGFIGWHVCERLRNAGWTVVAIVRPDSGKPLPDGVERVEARLDTAGLIRGCQRADTIVHAAGIVQARSVAEYTAVNVEGTRAVVEAAHALGVRVVHVSSLTAAGPAPVERPHSEGDAPAPITDYGASKLASEAVLRRASGVRWTIVRPAAVYGPRDRQFFPLFKAARRGLFLRLPNADRFWLTLVHVDDVARAIEAVCGSRGVDGETLCIGHSIPESFDGVLRTLALTFERRYRPLTVPFAVGRLAAWLHVGGLNAERLREARSAGFVCSVERAERCLGFQAAIDLVEGFRSAREWYVANGWLRWSG